MKSCGRLQSRAFFRRHAIFAVCIPTCETSFTKIWHFENVSGVYHAQNSVNFMLEIRITIFFLLLRFWFFDLFAVSRAAQGYVKTHSCRNARRNLLDFSQKEFSTKHIHSHNRTYTHTYTQTYIRIASPHAEWCYLRTSIHIHLATQHFIIK